MSRKWWHFGQTLVLPQILCRMSARLAYLELIVTYSKGKLGRRNDVSPNIFSLLVINGLRFIFFKYWAFKVFMFIIASHKKIHHVTAMVHSQTQSVILRTDYYSKSNKKLLTFMVLCNLFIFQLNSYNVRKLFSTTTDKVINCSASFCSI